MTIKWPLGLVLVVLVLGACCKHTPPNQDTKPKPEKDTPQPLTTEQITGYLDIDASPLPESGASPNLSLDWGFIKGYDGWVFINGELCVKMPFHQQRMLVPEPHEVRAVIARETQSGSVAFWTVSWRNVKIEKGRTLNINTKEAIDRWLLHSEKINGLEYYEPPQNPPAVFAQDFTIYDEDTDRRLGEAGAELDKVWQAFLNADAWKSIEAARRSPPSRPVVWLDLPVDLGGARQVNSGQLRLLAKVLKPNFRGWPPTVSERPGLSEGTRGRLNQICASLQQRGQYVQEVFKEMIGRLDKAPEDRR